MKNDTRLTKLFDFSRSEPQNSSNNVDAAIEDIKASTMPDAYKNTLRSAMATFDDVTFIWKYEEPSHNVSQGVPNIVETTWLPQVALLNDARLTAFITHGGQGSTLEAAYAGVPMLMLPTQNDQYRNAAMVKRAGLGETVNLSDLEGGDRFEDRGFEASRRRFAIYSTTNSQYEINARKTAAMLKTRPFSAKEKVIRNMEFLARFGPLRMLDHEGRNLNFIQYYMIDVLAFLAVLSILIVGFVLMCCFLIFHRCYKLLGQKNVSLKQE